MPDGHDFANRMRFNNIRDLITGMCFSNHRRNHINIILDLLNNKQIMIYYQP